MPDKRQYRTALAWQIGLAAYMQLISWVPLRAWNYQPCCPTGLQELRQGALSLTDVVANAAFLLPLMFFWLGARSERRWMMWLALVATSVWLSLQLWTWWPPYLFGASDRWLQVYARAFAQSTQILPRWGNHVPPDAMHLTLQVMLIGSVTTGASALLRPSRNTVQHEVDGMIL